MCVAIVKPVNIKIPSKEILYNCFKNNPHGAGYSYSNGDFVIINKGFETFDSFYKSLLESEANEDKLVFIHFRIANRGLKDRGNTHPFPISNNLTKLRIIHSNHCKYALIHNGLFNFNDKEYLKYEPLNVISDTMLFSMKLHERLEKLSENIENISSDYSLPSVVAYNLLTNTTEYTPYINNMIKDTCRFAIMGVENKFQLFGKWIEEDGIYYSNNSFKQTKSKTRYVYMPCNYCQTFIEKDEMIKTKVGFCCKQCYHKIYIPKYGDETIADKFIFKKICKVCNTIIDSNKMICNECKNVLECYLNKKNKKEIKNNVYRSN